MQKEELLAAKAAQLQRELDEWVQGRELLSPGEELVFSLRIVKTYPLVRRDVNDTNDTEAFTISAACKRRFKGEFVRPATLSTQSVEQLLRRCQNGQVSSQMRDLLITNRNRPSYLYVFTITSVNKALEAPLEGKHFRLVTGKDGRGGYCVQLWEVERAL